MKKVIEFLKGKKTYLVGAATIVYALGVNRHWWPSDAEVWGTLGATGAMTLRAAIAKLLVALSLDPQLNATAPINGAPAAIKTP